jgi:hypothetical protein
MSLSVFWTHHTLQEEVSGSGRLNKRSTNKIIPGKLGQSYISPTEATEPKSSSSSGINYVCERVI